MEKNFPYNDILDLPHPVSRRYRQMTMVERGAQFSPFAALVGYEATLEETARLTEDRPILEEHLKAELDQKLLFMQTRGASAAVTFFTKDCRKEGGKKQTLRGRIRKIDPVSRLVIFESGRIVLLDDICSIDLDQEELSLTDEVFLVE